jgi:hypothetical protein
MRPSGYFEGRKVDSNFIVEQLLRLFNALPKSHEAGVGGADEETVRSILASQGEDARTISKFWRDKGSVLVEIKVRLDNASQVKKKSKDEILSVFNSWRSRQTKRPEVVSPTGTPEPRQPTLTPQPVAGIRLEPTLEESFGPARAEEEKEPRLRREERQLIILDKTSQLLPILRDQFSVSKKDTLPKGFLHEYYLAADPAAQALVIEKFKPKLLKLKIKHEKAKAEGKIKELIESDELSRKASSLFNKSRELRKLLASRMATIGTVTQGTAGNSEQVKREFETRPRTTKSVMHGGSDVILV